MPEVLRESATNECLLSHYKDPNELVVSTALVKRRMPFIVLLSFPKA